MSEKRILPHEQFDAIERALDEKTAPTTASDDVSRGLLASLQTFVEEHARGIVHEPGDAVILIDEAAKEIDALTRPAGQKHEFWGAGEPDCPREIKAGNGELRTLRCKVCGKDNPLDDYCTRPAGDVERVALVERLTPALKLLDGLEVGQDCEEFAYANGDGFQSMTHIPEAFEALRALPDAIAVLNSIGYSRPVVDDELERLRKERDYLAGMVKAACETVDVCQTRLSEMVTRIGVLTEGLEGLIADCTRTAPNVHDDCGTRIIGAPTVEGLRKAQQALTGKGDAR